MARRRSRPAARPAADVPRGHRSASETRHPLRGRRPLRAPTSPPPPALAARAVRTGGSSAYRPPGLPLRSMKLLIMSAAGHARRRRAGGSKLPEATTWLRSRARSSTSAIAMRSAAYSRRRATRRRHQLRGLHQCRWGRGRSRRCRRRERHRAWPAGRGRVGSGRVARPCLDRLRLRRDQDHSVPGVGSDRSAFGLRRDQAARRARRRDRRAQSPHGGSGSWLFGAAGRCFRRRCSGLRPSATR